MNTQTLLTVSLFIATIFLAPARHVTAQQADAPQAATSESADADDTAKDSHTLAVEEFFLVMKMQQTTDQMIDQMLQVQIQQQPQLANFQDVMTSFLRKHVSYDALKEDMVNLYRKEFTEDEIRQMTAFYRSPVGQKAVSKLPTLAAAGAQIGMSRVQANMGELQQAIQKRQNELQNQ